MAFREKASAVLSLRPDLLIVPECESLAILRRNSRLHQPALFSNPPLCLDDDHSLWIGKEIAKQNKGLAVFTFGEYSLRELPFDLSNGPILCLPLHVQRNGVNSFDLMAVWSFYGSTKLNRGKNPMTHGLEDFSSVFGSEHLVVAGDFNSPINFEERGPGGFKATNAALESRGLVNAYNVASGEPLNQESQPTYYMYFQRERSYHIDHIYVPRAWINGMRAACGDFQTWVAARLSDHVPVVVDIADSAMEP